MPGIFKPSKYIAQAGLDGKHENGQGLFRMPLAAEVAL